jgi:hypothetical protein
VAGRVTGSGLHTRVEVWSLPNRTDYLPAESVLFTAIDPLRGTLSGTRTTEFRNGRARPPERDSKARPAGRSSRMTWPFEVALPPLADGSWVLNLKVVPIGQKLTGTATITFPNDEAFNFVASGTALSGNRTYRILLLGTGVAKGATLILTTAGPEMQLQSVSGRVCGQRVSLIE